jgi:hypothetical protein
MHAGEKRIEPQNAGTKKPEPPTAEQYQKARLAKALDWCPPVRPCQQCKWPVVDGYCCSYCDSTHP